MRGENIDIYVVVLHKDSPTSGAGITLAGGCDYENKEITVSVCKSQLAVARKSFDYFVCNIANYVLVIREVMFYFLIVRSVSTAAIICSLLVGLLSEGAANAQRRVEHHQIENERRHHRTITAEFAGP